MRPSKPPLMICSASICVGEQVTEPLLQNRHTRTFPDRLKPRRARLSARWPCEYRAELALGHFPRGKGIFRCTVRYHGMRTCSDDAYYFGTET